MARAWGLLLAIGVRLRAGDTCVPHGRGSARSGLVGGVLAGWQRGLWSSVFHRGRAG